MARPSTSVRGGDVNGLALPRRLQALVDHINKKDAEYKADKAKWTADSPMVKSVAKISGAEVKDVPDALAAYGFPSAKEQATKDWLSGGKDSLVARALLDTSRFLKEQGRITDVAADYAKFANDEYVKGAK